MVKHLSLELLEVLHSVSNGGIAQFPYLEGYPRTKSLLEDYAGEAINLETREEQDLLDLGKGLLDHARAHIHNCHFCLQTYLNQFLVREDPSYSKTLKRMASIGIPQLEKIAKNEGQKIQEGKERDFLDFIAAKVQE